MSTKMCGFAMSADTELLIMPINVNTPGSVQCQQKFIENGIAPHTCPLQFYTSENKLPSSVESIPSQHCTFTFNALTIANPIILRTACASSPTIPAHASNGVNETGLRINLLVHSMNQRLQGLTTHTRTVL